MKPILACDVDFNKIKYPVLGFPKIDGVRALVPGGKLVGRSGKPFKNKLNTKFYSELHFDGFDGEMVVDRIAGFGICNETTSALSTIQGDVETRFCLFDYLPTGANSDKPYHMRLSELERQVYKLYEIYPESRHRIWVIPYKVLNNQKEIEKYEIEMLEKQFEGIILRDPNGVYKHGRTTARESNYLRLKRFMDAEIVVTSVRQGQTNSNELKYNPNGYAERATVAENMAPNGMVGTIVGTAVEDVTFLDRVIIRKGELIEVSPGKLSHDERRHYYENQLNILGKVIKYQFFPVGIKDKPRFPTFQGFRDPVDMG